MLNSEPIEDEIPVGREDLSEETQEVLQLYDRLPDRWEGFSGYYLGKELVILPILFEQLRIVEYIRLYCWEIIPYIDGLVAKDVADKIKKKIKSGDKTSG
jgi:hypothetical protein